MSGGHQRKGLICSDCGVRFAVELSHECPEGQESFIRAVMDIGLEPLSQRVPVLRAASPLWQLITDRDESIQRLRKEIAFLEADLAEGGGDAE